MMTKIATLKEKLEVFTLAEKDLAKEFGLTDGFDYGVRVFVTQPWSEDGDDVLYYNGEDVYGFEGRGEGTLSSCKEYTLFTGYDNGDTDCYLFLNSNKSDEPLEY